ncbi:MAG: hypothetical protein WCS87_19765 [Methylococcaceae bacterium]
MHAVYFKHEFTTNLHTYKSAIMKRVKPVTNRPTEHLKAIAKKYPQAWKKMDVFRADKGNWPQWCFCPVACATVIVSLQNGFQDRFQVTEASMNDIGILAALSAWRAGKSLYLFDRTIYNSLISGGMTGNLPSEFLYNLPEWCVYVETPGNSFRDTTVYGFFAHLNLDLETNRHELCLVLDTPDGLCSTYLYIGNWTINKALRSAVEASDLHCREVGLESFDFTDEDIEREAKEFEPFVALVLYLCTKNAEIEYKNKVPPKPIIKWSKKHGQQIVAPAKSRNLNVGVRIGAALRHAQQVIRPVNHTGGTHAQPIPHVRTSHWHIYKTGKGRINSILKWLPPILVNVSDVDKMPVVLKKAA